MFTFFFSFFFFFAVLLLLFQRSILLLLGLFLSFFKALDQTLHSLSFNLVVEVLLSVVPATKHARKSRTGRGSGVSIFID